MGKTRKRVTFLVLSLEGIGLVMIFVAIYLAGDVRLSCDRATSTTAQCRAEEKRFLGLISMHRLEYDAVSAAVSELPAVGRSDHWLSLEGPSGATRVLAGSERRTREDVARFNTWIQDETSDTLDLRRSAAPWALGTALFGCVWIFVISLIMREFLGYHTPWWWRVLGRK